MNSRPTWNQEKLLNVIRSNGGEIEYNPLAHSKAWMHRCVMKAKKAGVVTTYRLSPSRVYVGEAAR